MVKSISLAATTLEGQLAELVAEGKRLELDNGQTPRLAVEFDLVNSSIELSALLPISLGASTGGWSLSAGEFIEPLLSVALSTPDYSIFENGDFVAGIDMNNPANPPQATIAGALSSAPFSPGVVSNLISTGGYQYNAQSTGQSGFVGSSLRVSAGGRNDFRSAVNIPATANEMYAVVVGIDDFARVSQEINLLYQLKGHQPKVLANGNLLTRYQRQNNQQVAEEVAIDWLANQANVFVLDVRGNEIDYWVNGALIHTLRPGAITLGNKRNDIYLKEADFLFSGHWTDQDKPSPEQLSVTLKDAFKNASFT